MQGIVAVILAAGKSTRMEAKKSKLLFRIHNKPVIQYVANACKKIGLKEIIVVVGFNSVEIKKILGDRFQYALQEPQLGTGHALLQVTKSCAAWLNSYKGNLVVLPGDAPFITPVIIKKLINHHNRTGATATLITAVFENPPSYGRVIRNIHGKIMKIIEEKDATPTEKLVREVCTSHYCFNAPKVLSLLPKIKTNNCKKEYYLTDIIEILSKQGEKISALQIKESVALKGINTKTDLYEMRKIHNRHS
ncbi:MAG: NTP transferase domain-containing protein [Planctomycetota bacterium]